MAPGLLESLCGPFVPQGSRQSPPAPRDFITEGKANIVREPIHGKTTSLPKSKEDTELITPNTTIPAIETRNITTTASMITDAIMMTDTTTVDTPTDTQIMNGTPTEDTPTDTPIMNGTPTEDLNGKVSLVCESFNCHGFKHSADYVCDRLRDCNVMCLSETWLMPHEQNVIKNTIMSRMNMAEQDCCVFVKSGMSDIDIPSYTGRPFGGVAVICKTNGQVSFQELETSCNRILPVGVYDLSGNLVQIIVSVYMPYYKQSDIRQTEAFIATIDDLQNMIDRYAMSTPIRICGDFNAQLPQGDKLHRTWYKEPRFTKHSAILYDFITANDLKVANFMFRQSSSYTYFCHKSGIYTYIDHVLISGYDSQSITDCKIVQEEPGNVSDHLPLRVTICAPASIPSTSVVSSMEMEQRKSYLSWDDRIKRAHYKDILEYKINDLPPLAVSSELDRCKAQLAVDDYLSKLTSTFHEAAHEAKCSSTRSFKPKAYWCPELSRLRDKKKFWWRLWIENDRPKVGVISDCYRGIKRLYRKISRRCIDSVTRNKNCKLSFLFNSRKLTAFWNALKRDQKHSVRSNLGADQFAKYYATNMSDNADLSSEQQIIADTVNSCFSDHISSPIPEKISSDMMSDLIGKLNRSCAPGLDGVSACHLFYGKSESLVNCLSRLYSTLISNHIVPGAFSSGLIIPILKKPGMDPNNVSSFRPITISSTFAKLMELYLTPKNIDICDSQFGFQAGKSTTMACSLLNDVIAYCNYRNSPVYIASLDAEKCFDKIWHNGLHYKLMNVLPLNTWLYMVEWYQNLSASVKWQGIASQSFTITRGVRQGSALSPLFFNIFIDDLLRKLRLCSQGVRIGENRYNSMAYADDITLFSLTVPGLQDMIDICSEYANMWRFTFSMSKSKCLCVGPRHLRSDPKWHLGNVDLDNVDSLEILGVIFDAKHSGAAQVQSRSRKCRQSFYSKSQVGMNYPGLSSEAKAYLWKSTCLPSLLYGMESVSLSAQDLKHLDSLQGSLIKQCFGLGKRSHHTNLCKALGISPVSEIINQRVITLWNKIFKVKSPTGVLCLHWLQGFVGHGIIVPGTLLSRVILTGLSPTRYAHRMVRYSGTACNSGVVDTLRTLVLDDNFNKKDSSAHAMVKLLTSSLL